MSGEQRHKSFAVVCIGMSAGGLAPIKALLRNMSADTGMAFVVIPHLLPAEPSRLPELLGIWTKMPVAFATMQVPLRANHVYVIPPDRDMRIIDDQLDLQPRSKTSGWSNVITLFLLSLAQSRLHPGVAIILSGAGSDGAAALKAIRESDGIAIAQDTLTSEHSDMPQAAINTGYVDYVLSAPGIAAKLEEIGQGFRDSAAGRKEIRQ